MALFEVNSTLRLPPEFFTAVSSVVTAIHAEGRKINMKLDEALDAIKQVGDEQAVAKDTLLQEVAKVGDAVNALEQQISDALAGTLTPEQEQKLADALANFRSNTQSITDAAAAVKAGTDDAGDGTAT